MRAARPNILWIVTTQWRAQACGYAGDANVRTPALDALASESIDYFQAVTPHPFGPFARAALLTGVASPQNGIKDYFDPLPVDARTVAHALRGRGYRTGFFGKWHLWKRDRAAALVGPEHARVLVPPKARGGFEHWEGFESGFLLNDPLLHGTGLPEPVPFRGYQSDVLCDRAGEWSARSAPWFCMVSLEAPHPPYDAPTPKPRRLSPETIQLRANVPRDGAVETRARSELAGYYAHIEATDSAIGRLVRAVESERTIVLFTSVHGDMHGAHGLFRKGWPHEESVRVPLLVRIPGVPSRRDPAPISLIDLAALTVTLAAGNEYAHVNRPAKISMPSVVQLPHQCDRLWHGWRTPVRKLVCNADGTPWLFFDLERDPHETVNLALDPANAGAMAACGAPP